MYPYRELFTFILCRDFLWCLNVSIHIHIYDATKVEQFFFLFYKKGRYKCSTKHEKRLHRDTFDDVNTLFWWLSEVERKNQFNFSMNIIKIRLHTNKILLFTMKKQQQQTQSMARNAPTMNLCRDLNVPPIIFPTWRNQIPKNFIFLNRIDTKQIFLRLLQNKTVFIGCRYFVMRQCPFLDLLSNYHQISR